MDRRKIKGWDRKKLEEKYGISKNAEWPEIKAYIEEHNELTQKDIYEILCLWDGESYDEELTINNYTYKIHIERQDWGFVNGYVGVERNHELYGKDYEEIENDINVHGGLTYSGEAYWTDDDDFWYFGFDTAHIYDYIPGHYPYGIYRDMRYVYNECKKLLDQLVERNY